MKMSEDWKEEMEQVYEAYQEVTTPKAPDTTTLLKRLRNQRAYHLKRINDPNNSHKERNQQKLTAIIEKISELTGQSVDEITHEYNKGQKGRPFKTPKTENTKNEASF